MTATELAQRETIVLDMVDGVGGPGPARSARPHRGEPARRRARGPAGRRLPRRRRRKLRRTWSVACTALCGLNASGTIATAGCVRGAFRGHYCLDQNDRSIQDCWSVISTGLMEVAEVLCGEPGMLLAWVWRPERDWHNRDGWICAGRVSMPRALEYVHMGCSRSSSNFIKYW
jgi:hypothetical protein